MDTNRQKQDEMVLTEQSGESYKMKEQNIASATREVRDCTRLLEAVRDWKRLKVTVRVHENMFVC